MKLQDILLEKLRDMVSIPIYHHTTEERALGIMNGNMLVGSKQYEEVLNLDRTLKQSKHKTFSDIMTLVFPQPIKQHK
jgi:hypothetical protein